jgi:hypothetical protein
MTETYDAKLKRRMHTRSKFPSALQQVPLRFVDAIAVLDARELDLVARASIARLRSIGVALSRLKEAGEAVTIEFLLKDNQSEALREATDLPGVPKPGDEVVQEIEVLSDILNECFPGMPSHSAKALAESPVMLEVLTLATSLRAAMESKNCQSDFVVVALYAVIKYVKSSIEDKIRSNPAFLQTVQNSGLVWEGGA